MKQRKYAEGFKEQALGKVFARSAGQMVESIAAGLGMNLGTLRGWMKVALRDQKPPPVKAGHAAEVMAVTSAVASTGAVMRASPAFGVFEVSSVLIAGNFTRSRKS